MSLDPAKNFARVTVNQGYDDDDTSIVLASGHGARLPQPSTAGAFNAIWYNATDYPNPTDDPNVEIVRVTARSTDTLTVTRAQESTTATTKNTAGKTYKMILGITKKMIDDIQSALNALAITGADTRVIFMDGANTPSTDSGLTYNKVTGQLTALKISAPQNTTSERFGSGADNSSGTSVAVGNIAVNAGGADSVAVGYDARSFGAGAVAIGRGSRATGSDTVAIGHDAQTSTAECIAIGYTTRNDSIGGVVIGYAARNLGTGGGLNFGDNSYSGTNSQNSIVMGGGVTVDTKYSLVIGWGSDTSHSTSVTTADNQALIGITSDVGGGINDFIIGRGVLTASPQNIRIRTSGGSGTNVAGADISIEAGLGTGNATPGKLYLKTAKAGSTGTTLQTIGTRIIVGDTYAELVPHGTSSGNTFELRFSELAANGSNYTGFKAANSLAQTTVYVLPSSDPSSGQVLSASAPSGGVVTLSWADNGSGGGAPSDASYLTLGTNGTLTNERVLTAGTSISFDDAGAGGALTINFTGSAAAGGSNKQVQVNSSGTTAGAAGFEYQAAASPNVLIQAQDATYKALVVKGATSQSVPIQQWQTSDGTPIANLYASVARMDFFGVTTSSAAYQVFYDGPDNGNAAYLACGIDTAGSSFGHAGIVLIAGASGTGVLQPINLVVGSGVFTMATDGMATMASGSSDIKLLVKGGNTQIQQWQDASGNVVAKLYSTTARLDLYGVGGGAFAGGIYYDGPDTANAAYFGFGIDPTGGTFGFAGVNLGSGSNGTGVLRPFNFLMAGTPALKITTTKSVVVGSAALATDATGGFLYIPTSAGAPTGTPGAQTGTVAVEYDTSNNKLKIYNGAWKEVQLT